MRKGEKGYGTNKAMEGKAEPGQRVVMVEDVVTSGGAALMAVDKLREAGLEVRALLCVVDREEGGREAIEAEGLAFDPLFTATSLGIKKRRVRRRAAAVRPAAGAVIDEGRAARRRPPSLGSAGCAAAVYCTVNDLHRRLERRPSARPSPRWSPAP